MKGKVVVGVAAMAVIFGGVANADEGSAAATIRQLQQKIQESERGGYVCQSIGANAAANFNEIYAQFARGQQMHRSGYGGDTYFGAAEYQAAAYLSQFRSAGC